jgi:ribosomal protein L11 methyltransferase
VTIPCTRAQGEAIAHAEPFPDKPYPPVLVADEPDESRPDEWLIHAYFDHEPRPDELQRLNGLGNGEARVEQLGESDWVTMSQSGLQPIRAGRFYVHTPTHRGSVPANSIPFEIDASLAFGTGQHETTSGCLSALDRLQREGARFTNIADIGTGTGLLAFAALALWPDAKGIATDIDAVAVDVARDNAAINQVKLGHGAGELLLAVAAGFREGPGAAWDGRAGGPARHTGRCSDRRLRGVRPHLPRSGLGAVAGSAAGLVTPSSLSMNA